MYQKGQSTGGQQRDRQYIINPLNPSESKGPDPMLLDLMFSTNRAIIIIIINNIEHLNQLYSHWFIAEKRHGFQVNHENQLMLKYNVLSIWITSAAHKPSLVLYSYLAKDIEIPSHLRLKIQIFIKRLCGPDIGTHATTHATTTTPPTTPASRDINGGEPGTGDTGGTGGNTGGGVGGGQNGGGGRFIQVKHHNVRTGRTNVIRFPSGTGSGGRSGGK
ncbi:unnamed protein product, partial [Medioppia subpectinata]